MEVTPIDPFLTAADIAALLQISYEGALSFIRHSGVAYVKVGRQYRVSQEAFRKFIERDQPIVVPLQAQLEPINPTKNTKGGKYYGSYSQKN